MSLGGNNSNQSSQSTSQQAIDPGILATQNANITRAQGVANAPVAPYTGLLTAPTNSDLTGSASAAQGLLGTTAPVVNGSTYNPSMINPSSVAPVAGSAYSASTIDPSSIPKISTSAVTPQQIAAYQDPYQQSVINSFLTNNAQANQQQIEATDAKAVAAGAFGGSRSGVAEALTNQLNAQSRDATVAGLESSGYQSALTAAQADAQRKLSGDTSNQSTDASVAAQNAGLLSTASQFTAAQKQAADLANQGVALNIAGANAGAANTGAQFDASQTQAAALADQAAKLQAAGISASAAGLLGQLGTQQQNTDQTGLQAQYQAYLNSLQLPLQQQQTLNQAVGLLPNPVLSTSQSTGSGSSFGLSASALPSTK